MIVVTLAIYIFFGGLFSWCGIMSDSELWDKYRQGYEWPWQEAKPLYIRYMVKYILFWPYYVIVMVQTHFK